jgi:hypothetical protein
MKPNKFLTAIGFRYVVNRETKEIHRATFCQHVAKMSHPRLCTGWWARRLLMMGYDGCRWCWPEKNNG